jgi:hypothetical protein
MPERRCAWCDRLLAPSKGCGSKATHGICGACLRRIAGERERGAVDDARPEDEADEPGEDASEAGSCRGPVS